MDEVLAILKAIRDKCERYQDELGRVRPGALSGCFGMLFNGATWALELLSYYRCVWDKIGAQGHTIQEVESARKENGERVIETAKWHFVAAISAMEFSAKEHTKNTDDFGQLYRSHKRVYLGNILEESTRLSPPLLDADTLEQWKCLLEIRNTSVHNNGIAGLDWTCRVSQIDVEFRKGVMLRGNLKFFPNLTDAAIELFHSWASGMLRTV